MSRNNNLGNSSAKTNSVSFPGNSRSSKISCVMIACNEEARIERALRAVQWCGDVVVVDSGSTDRTNEIAARCGARVIRHAFEGYGKQKIFATEQATYDWVLSIDADEVVSEELAQEIQAQLTNPADLQAVGFEIPITNIFMGQEIKYWGEGPRLHLRLFDRRKGGFTPDVVHEGVVVQGVVQKLSGKVLHYSYRNVFHYFQKFNEYTTRGAEKLFRTGTKPKSVVNLVFRVPIKFVNLYFFRGGFINGFPGFVWCFFSSIYPTVKYIKLNELWLERRS